MRWLAPKSGERRTRTFFALFPVTIGRETRWLEKVTVMEQFSAFGFTDCYYEDWEKIKFVDREAK